MHRKYKQFAHPAGTTGPLAAAVGDRVLLGRTLAWLSACLVLVLPLIAGGCGDDTTPIVGHSVLDTSVPVDTGSVDTGVDAGAPEDTTPGIDVEPGSDIAAGEDGDATSGDVTTSDIKQLNCPGTGGEAGCPCTSVAQCASNFCIDTPAGQQCAALCGGDSCPDASFKCATVSAPGGDVVNICVPKYAKICDPCGTNQECQGPGNGSSRCVDQGDNGAFCATGCAADADCPDTYECKDVKDIAGAPGKQCVVKAGGACTCGDAAIKLQLSTKCFAVSGENKCEGKRTCLPAGAKDAPANGGLSACLAPKPTDETCNGVDDNCNGQTDEKTCDDKNACSDDVCVGAAGCKNTNNTLPCDDGSVCTTNDACKEGKCNPGVPLDCDDKNPCTTDSCDLAKGCTHTNADAIACNSDDNPCTENDQCAGGKCIAGAAKACATDDPCLVGKCSIDSGACKYGFQAGSPCNDGSACTSGETCIIDTCKGDQVKCDDSNACTADSCDPKTGCLHKAAAGACDDGNACTTGDACDDKGTCVGAALDVTATCDDFNACTADTCDAKKGCTHKNTDGIACDDNNPCTINDACKTGGCVSTTNTCGCAVDADCAGKGDGNLCNGVLFCDTAKLPYQCVIKTSTIVKCDDSLNGACQNNACDPSTGKCKLVKKSDGFTCDADGSICTVGDACKDGTCTAGPNQACDDKNACTDDSCNPTLGCKYTPNANPCDADTNPCTENDACALGTCVAGKAKLCDDGEACTLDKCKFATGKCDYAWQEGYPCNDGSACTLGDKCVVDKCAGSAANCDDSNPCTGDSCDPLKGCAHTNVAGTCNDADACTENDQCAAGGCKGTAIDAKKCDDSNVCTTDSCDSKTGCAHTSASGACDDGNACTVGDACADGKCSPGTNTCACAQDSDCKDDGNLCNGTMFCDKTKLPYQCVVNPSTIVKCDATVNGACQTNECVTATGACVLNKKADTLPCDADSSACTAGDACLDGKCTPGKVVVCDDKNPCTDDSCDPTAGCKYKNNTAPCDGDSNACTQNDTCDAGSCVLGKNKVCDDKESCTQDSCDITTGNCKYAPLPSKSCTDDNVCTVGDLCGNNASTGTYTCVPGKAATCDDGNPCTTDTCDPSTGCKSTADTSITAPCYSGPSGTSGVGICKPGKKTCTINATYGACVGDVLPAAKELCNGVDDNCDNTVDEGCKPTGFIAKMGNAVASGTGTKYGVRALLGGSLATGTASGSGTYNVSLGFYQYMKKFLGL